MKTPINFDVLYERVEAYLESAGINKTCKENVLKHLQRDFTNRFEMLNCYVLSTAIESNFLYKKLASNGYSPKVLPHLTITVLTNGEILESRLKSKNAERIGHNIFKNN